MGRADVKGRPGSAQQSPREGKLAEEASNKQTSNGASSKTSSTQNARVRSKGAGEISLKKKNDGCGVFTDNMGRKGSALARAS